MSNPFLDEQNHQPLDFSQMTPEQLQEKQIELERREQQLQYQQMKLQEVQKSTGAANKPPNWPRCKPLIYHNIYEEIPEGGRSLVRRVYFSWFLFCWTLSLNAVALLAGVIEDSSLGVDFGVSLALFIILIPVSFVFWYRPLYVAVKNDRGMSYFFFFFNYVCHVAFCIVMCIGIPSSGSGGFINAIACLKFSAASGIILLVSSGNWVLFTLFCIWQLQATIRYYRARGHTIQGDANKMAVQAASSPQGREVIVGAAVEVAKNANTN